MSDTPHVVVRFGQLPIGASFTVRERERDPADRRRWRHVRRTYVKRTHGTISGYADGAMLGSRAFRLSEYVAIDVADLRLVTIAAANQSHARIEAPHVA